MPIVRVLLDHVYEYDTSKDSRGKRSREQLLHDLANHFRPVAGELKQCLEFWEKVESARLYGLVTTNFETTEGLENLRAIVRIQSGEKTLTRIMEGTTHA